MHHTTKAFERFFRIEAEDVRNLFPHTASCGKKVGKKIAEFKKSQS
jgi:hypothetical protein